MRCYDCQVKEGEFHRVNCSYEECPFCHNYLISCDCRYTYLKTSRKKELTISQLEQWYKILNDNGRIPFGKETNPIVREIRFLVQVLDKLTNKVQVIENKLQKVEKYLKDNNGGRLLNVRT